MVESRNNLYKYAMHFGTYMGIFWIFKFILFPLGIEIPFLQFLFLILTICVPFLGYYYARMYRNKVCGGNISCFQAWFFTLLVYIFASLLTGVVHYIYFQFLDHGYLYNSYYEIIGNIRNLKVEGTDEFLTQFENSLDILGGLSPIELTFQLISLDIFYGAIFAIPTALLLVRWTKRHE